MNRFEEKALKDLAAALDAEVARKNTSEEDLIDASELLDAVSREVTKKFGR